MRGGLLGRRWQPPPLPLFPAAKRSSAPASLLFALLHRLLPVSRLLRLFLLLALLSLVPAAFFHLRLRRFHSVHARKCGRVTNPPMVCAHGDDSTNAFPNSMEEFRMALVVRVDWTSRGPPTARSSRCTTGICKKYLVIPLPKSITGAQMR
ncbi:unnamed protein product [Urochloa humidicola]